MKTKNTVLAAAALAVLAVSAKAQTVMTYTGDGLNENVTVFSPYTPGGQNAIAGVANITLANAPAGYPTSFGSFCIDLADDVFAGDSYNVDLVPLPDPGVGNSGRIAWLYNNYTPTLATSADAAGMQLAIWDIEYDGGDGLASGTVTATASAGAIAAATNFEALSVGQTDTATWLRAQTHPVIDGTSRNQNFIGPKTPNVPEPGSLSLLATFGLPLLGMVRRRR